MGSNWVPPPGGADELVFSLQSSISMNSQWAKEEVDLLHRTNHDNLFYLSQLQYDPIEDNHMTLENHQLQKTNRKGKPEELSC